MSCRKSARNLGIDPLEPGETTCGAVHGAQELEIHGNMVRLIFASLRGKEAERAKERGDQEPHVNLQPVFSCGLVMVLREMHSALPSRIDKNGAQRSASGAAFSGAFGSIPRIGADFLRGPPKSVEVGPKLPQKKIYTKHLVSFPHI